MMVRHEMKVVFSALILFSGMAGPARGGLAPAA